MTACSYERPDNLIALISREEGSGARGAFEELVEINTDHDNLMTHRAIIRDGNGVIATQVARSRAAIGYISFSTYLDHYHALSGLSIDGFAPTLENMINGDYSLVRPFNMVYMADNIGEIERAFIAFAASEDGLRILEGLGAIVDFTDAVPFDMSQHDDLAGNLIMGGSTSTEKEATTLAEEFTALFPQVAFTYEATGSGAGIRNAEEGVYAIGFASRPILASELETGLNYVTFCLDGIVIVIHPDNDTTGVTTEQLRQIYMGHIISWDELR